MRDESVALFGPTRTIGTLSRKAERAISKAPFRRGRRSYFYLVLKIMDLMRLACLLKIASSKAHAHQTSSLLRLQHILYLMAPTKAIKFGRSCKYDHPTQGAGSSRTVSSNCYVYPLHKGGREYSYYVRARRSKFGSTCKFHHPEQAGAPIPSLVPAFYLMQLASSHNYQLASSKARYVTGSLHATIAQSDDPPRIVPLPCWSLPVVASQDWPESPRSAPSARTDSGSISQDPQGERVCRGMIRSL